MASDFLYGLLPEHLLLSLILILMVLEIMRADKGLAGPLFLLTALLGCGALVAQLGSDYTLSLIPGEVVIDRFALLAKLVILGCGTVLGFFSITGAKCYKTWMLLACSLFGGMVIMESAGFISLFIGIEMLSLPGFAMMLHGRGSSVACEGAFKYLLMSSVATALMLFGISLVYAHTGTLAIADFVGAAWSGGAHNWAAGALVLSGFFIKAAVFPFHAWAPDAYDSAKLPVTAFLASVIKAAVVLALVRIVGNAPLNSDAALAVTVLSVGSIFYGNVAAIQQTTFKRLLAYSSIAHAGYMMFALTDTTGGRVESLFYYVTVYAVTSIIACACFSLLCRDTADQSDPLACLDGAYYSHPVPSFILAVSVLSLAGIPPFPGFLAKFLIFKSVIASGYLVPAVFAFAGSFLGVIYYLGIVFRLFKPTPATETARTALSQNLSQNWTWGGVLIGSLALAIFMLFPDVFHRLLSVV